MTEKITYSSAYDNHPHFRNSHPEDPYILTGHFRKEYMQRCVDNNEPISRSGNNIVPDYVVYECDTLPLEEQLRIINGLDRTCIRYITFSGHKSYHVLFKIKVPEDITREEYKEIAQDVLNYYGVLDYADKQCLSLGRLSRNPNGIREDGTKQTCIFDNPNCDTIDLTENVLELRRAAKAYDDFNEYVREINERNKPRNIPQRSPEEVLSRIGKECDAKRGYEMYVNNDYPKGEQYLSYAAGMYSVCISANCDEAETIDFIRSFLLEVSKYHPSNISERTARNWKPPRRYH